MRTTPRTQAVWEKFATGTTVEDELNNALEKINRLKQAGDVMYTLLDSPSISMRTTEYDNALQGWDDAKIK